MRPIKTPLMLAAAFALFLFGLFSCTYTSHFPPGLNGKADTILAKIKAANNFEDIELQENKVRGSNGNSTDITIKLYNGKNLPTDTMALKKLGRDIASQIKPAIKDTTGINAYIVLFDIRVVDGSMTRNSYSGYQYKPGDL